MTTPNPTRTAPLSEEGVAFPPGFLWGAATAAYQIEGAVHEGGRGESIWDRFSHTPGKTLNGDIGDVACDHYHRLNEDVALMRELGLKAYRFSIAWPRLFPEGRGRANAAGLDFYNRLVDALLSAGIQPMPTLYHWDLPQALQDQGGWPHRDTARRFADYAATAFETLGDRVSHWLTINEPWCVAHLGYMNGEHAPGHKDLKENLEAAHTVLFAHGLAVQRFREIAPNGKIGITVNLGPVHPATDSDEDHAAAKRWDAYFNRWFLDPLHHGEYPKELQDAFGEALPTFTGEEREAVTSPCDHVGVNYYSRSIMGNDAGNDFLQIRGASEPGAKVTAMGWEIYPDGLRELLLWLRDTYNNPVLYVTENGAAFDETPGPNGVVEDVNRRDYLDAHFRAAHAAMKGGARLAGYFVWSLLDNFEWQFGYDRRFGIVHVDYPTQTRTPKLSAQWYADFIRSMPSG